MRVSSLLPEEPKYKKLLLLIVTPLIIAFGVSLNSVRSLPQIPRTVPPARINKTFTPDSPTLLEHNVANVVSKINTSQPVVFLTMDDGMVKNEKVLDFIKRRKWPVSIFPAHEYAKDDYGYFKELAKSGATIQNHTMSHRYLTGLTYKQQLEEICSASDVIETTFGKRPTLLRAPGGHYDADTLIAAKQCGLKAVVMWSAKVDNGEVQFQKGNKLVPGDIVLMHFRPKVMDDLLAFDREIIKQGLYVAKLEEWLRTEE